MRIISQNGFTDIPYENFVFSITEDNYIVATRDSIASPSEIARGVIANYSTREKAEKAMRLLHEVYCRMPIILQNIEISEEYISQIADILKNCVFFNIPNEPPKVECIDETVFRFPKEEDL